MRKNLTLKSGAFCCFSVTVTRRIARKRVMCYDNNFVRPSVRHTNETYRNV